MFRENDCRTAMPVIRTYTRLSRRDRTRTERCQIWISWSRNQALRSISSQSRSGSRKHSLALSRQVNADVVSWKRESMQASEIGKICLKMSGDWEIGLETLWNKNRWYERVNGRITSGKSSAQNFSFAVQCVLIIFFFTISFPVTNFIIVLFLTIMPHVIGTYQPRFHEQYVKPLVRSSSVRSGVNNNYSMIKKL